MYEVAWREIVTRSRTKSFRIITAILVVAAVVGPIVAAVWPNDDDLRTVTVGVRDLPDDIRQAIELFAAGNVELEFQEFSESAALEEAVSSREVDVAVEPGPAIVWRQSVDFEILGILTNAFQQQDVLARGDALGLDEQAIADLFAPVDIEERFVEGSSDIDDLRRTVALVGLIAAFILPQVFGQLTLLSVVEEKSTRVVEVLLSHLRPRTLLMGKVVGLGGLALVQFLVAVVGGIGALLLTNVIEVPASVWRFVPVLVLAVVGGLAIYTTLFALLGSLISRQEDASQVMVPTFIPLIGGYFVGQAAIIGEADTMIARVLTFIPFTTPMLLPIRVARDAIAGWEVALALGVLVLGVWLLIRIAGRVYEFTLLHTGARVGWGELVRMSRGALG